MPSILSFSLWLCRVWVAAQGFSRCGVRAQQLFWGVWGIFFCSLSRDHICVPGKLLGCQRSPCTINTLLCETLFWRGSTWFSWSLPWLRSSLPRGFTRAVVSPPASPHPAPPPTGRCKLRLPLPHPPIMLLPLLKTCSATLGPAQGPPGQWAWL